MGIKVAEQLTKILVDQQFKKPKVSRTASEKGDPERFEICWELNGARRHFFDLLLADGRAWLEPQMAIGCCDLQLDERLLVRLSDVCRLAGRYAVSA